MFTTGHTLSYATIGHTTPEALPKFTGHLADLTAFTEDHLPKPGDLVVCLDASGGGGVTRGDTYVVSWVDAADREFAFLKLRGSPGAYAFRFAPFPQDSAETPRAFQVGDLVTVNFRGPWWTPGKACEVRGLDEDGDPILTDDEGDTLGRYSGQCILHTPATAKPTPKSPTEPPRASVTFLPGIGKLTPSEELAGDIEKLAETLAEAFDWADTAEGWGFWSDIERRLNAYAEDLRAAIPAPAPEPLDMRGLSVEPARISGCLRLVIDPSFAGGLGFRTLTPAAARALAEQLVVNAEAVERAAR